MSEQALDAGEVVGALGTEAVVGGAAAASPAVADSAPGAATEAASATGVVMDGAGELGMAGLARSLAADVDVVADAALVAGDGRLHGILCRIGAEFAALRAHVTADAVEHEVVTAARGVLARFDA